ncbi:MAG: recombinase family protein [Alicyclobacillaceae bacterium]|nr:recombinase family protein [Alicyclobacillaceae bacterium]
MCCFWENPPGTRLYAWVSSTKQKADGNLQRQRGRLERYAEEHGYDVVRVFAEQASGIHENRKRVMEEKPRL